MQPAIDGIVALLRGEKRDLRELVLDIDGAAAAFNRRVYELARTIPPGATMTYGDIARRLGSPGTARAVGQALGQNPLPIVVPCHRVLAADGRMGGFSAPGGVATKRRMLEIEGVEGVQPKRRRCSKTGAGLKTRGHVLLAKVPSLPVPPAHLPRLRRV